MSKSVMLSQKTEEVVEANLIPAVVPDLSEIPPVITKQPGRSFVTDRTDSRGLTHHYTRRNHQQSVNNPTGLARLSVAEQLLLQLDRGCAACDWDTKYSIKDVTGGEDSLILQAIEELNCCSCGSLRNVVIRDREDVPVARACFKEKNIFFNSLVLAVYAPPESLIGTVEEASDCCLLSSQFTLRNADGDNLFRISYQGGMCDSYFTVTSLENSVDEVAKILEKTGNSISLKFLAKMSITSKLIIVGFCLGVIHNRVKQQHIGPV